MPQSQTKVYEDTLNAFMRAHGVTECELCDAIKWGIQTGSLQMSIQSQISFHTNSARKELRSKNLSLPSGNDCREWHHRTVQSTNKNGQPTQKDLWSNIDYIRPAHMLQSLRQRCQAISRDKRQIEKDRDGYNELRALKGQRPIQLTLNFSYK